PIAIAITIERVRRIHGPTEIVVKAPSPAVVITQKTRIALPIVERTALTVAALNSGIRERARRLVTAHAIAAPSEARAPGVVSEITRSPEDPFTGACESVYTLSGG